MARHTTRSVDMNQVRENPEYQDNIKTLAESLIPKDFVKIDLTFPPYWRCGLAKGFRGKVMYRDERDARFVRYHIQNTGPVPVDCQKGPVDDGVVESVEPGRIFTIGAFATLPLDRLAGFEIVVICIGERELPANERSEGKPRSIYDFDVHVSKETEKLLASQRADDIQYIQQLQRNANRMALEEITKLAIKNRVEVNGVRAVNLSV